VGFTSLLRHALGEQNNCLYSPYRNDFLFYKDVPNVTNSMIS